MFVSHLSLIDFRNYENVDLELSPGINAFVGPNGQGKTNIVEAVGYLATLRSHRVASEAPLIRAGAQRGVIRSRIVRGDRASTVEVEITPGKSNRARINRGSLVRSREILGILHAVTFAPEDLVLVKGDPDARRTFLDTLCVQLVPRFAGILADYERVLRQRNTLLKSAGPRRRASAGGSVDLRTLDVWDEKLAQLGAQITTLRHGVIKQLAPYVAAAYDQVSSSASVAAIAYRSSLDAHVEQDESLELAPTVAAATIEARLLETLLKLRPKEVERGLTLVGPHRDDLYLSIDGLATKTHSSHGESWSMALALRLASYDLLTIGPSGDDVEWVPWAQDAEPVMILDDVFAELDARRRRSLVERVAAAKQVLITAAVAEDVPAELDGARFDVMAAEVARVI
ncbi:DNA replication/repair protein RecF [Rarobacter faecitabidus]|uniref:DNA replication and repair protein RecF n=1 Tax=Rarobacter faecitabidus TaxID=13243 RepID=A0A542ZPB9_RARFA|nr:DNA replication/repair protein RecF [Rarobacter faecitabidus]TQL62205.1 DNA replication and repair protein RecF [Rarobacter faecitabidus]